MKTLDLARFKSGKHKQQLEYKSFSPNKITNQWMLTDPKILNKLGKADRAIGRLDSFSELIPDIDFFIKMHVVREATLSSKIEGTQTTVEEALIKEEDIQTEKRNDWLEVQNYIDALKNAMQNDENLPLSNRLIKSTHKILLQGVRGENKLPGQYRTSQNWIGNTLKDAIFVPPHHTEIGDLMHDLEKFMNSEALDLDLDVPQLIKIAIIHYQFETIHPFLDGNGRIGRLLITLYLINKNILQRPTLYLSDFFERNRNAYYDKLTSARSDNDLISWIDFFLEGIIQSSQESTEAFHKVINLRNEIELKRLIQLGRKQTLGKQLIDELYKTPILSGKEIAQFLNVHPSTANRLIQDFMQLGILKELTGYNRNRLYSFNEYVQIFM